MRINQIKMRQGAKKWRQDAWEFPDRFSVLSFDEVDSLRYFKDVWLNVFYDVVSAESEERLGAQVWAQDQHTQMQLSRKSGAGQSAQWIGEARSDTDGKTQASYPENTPLGEFLFGLNLTAFKQWGLCVWPEGQERDFRHYIRNLQQTGEEGLSLAKMQESLAGAKRKMEEPDADLSKAREQYNAVKEAWEEANSRQEATRMMQIELRRSGALSQALQDKSAALLQLQSRVDVWRENMDYRTLRQMSNELERLEALLQEITGRLAEYIQAPQIDQELIDLLRDDCIAWADAQKRVEDVEQTMRDLDQEIQQKEIILEESPYHQLPEAEDRRLQGLDAERQMLLRELSRLSDLSKVLSKQTEIVRQEENALQELQVFAQLTPPEERKIVRTAKLLARWKREKICRALDDYCWEHWNLRGGSDRLTRRLDQFYLRYEVRSLEEFRTRLDLYRGGAEDLAALLAECAGMRQELAREAAATQTMQDCNEQLQEAYHQARVADLPEWLNGWNQYVEVQSRLVEAREALTAKTEELRQEEAQLCACANQLREQLRALLPADAELEDAMHAVMLVAVQMRAKCVTENEHTVLEEEYRHTLGDRDLDQLAGILEPIADLEREAGISDAQRREMLEAWQAEIETLDRRMRELEQELQRNQLLPALAVVEADLAKSRQQWERYENLFRSIKDAQNILEHSCQEWQERYGRDVGVEVNLLSSRLASPASAEEAASEYQLKQQYFAWRMGMAQLAAVEHPHLPLLFLNEEMRESEDFWQEKVAFLRKFSRVRPVIFGTSDPRLLKVIRNEAHIYDMIALEGR
jgi:exonuclease SbcC